MSGLALATSALTLRYGADIVLDIAPMAIAPGTFAVLSGASGSGKSSLLYVLSGIARPSTGSVRWESVNLSELGEAARDGWRLRHAGIIFQDFNLIEEMSPIENVVLPARFVGPRVGAQKDRARSLLAHLGVPERARTILMSRGEQQRVAIARALLGDPSVIFADEPTASLDRGSGERVIEILVGLAAEGRTVIAASHDPDLRAAADVEIMLDYGRVVTP